MKPILLLFKVTFRTGEVIKDIYYLQRKKPHLTLAHHYWKEWVSPGDTVIDATVGNGHDTLYLSKLLKGEGKLIGYDIQPRAIEQTKVRLEALSEADRSIVTLRLQSHTFFPEKRVQLIVYNLGYLPGGDKSITTREKTTLLSLKGALQAVGPRGSISITCYPGHSEGQREEIALVEFLKTLSGDEWHICHHQWSNRPFAPSLFFIISIKY